jgi:hypothetical protein
MRLIASAAKFTAIATVLIDDLPEPYRARGRTMTVDDALEYAVRHVD